MRVVEGRQNLVEGRHLAAQTTILKEIFDQLILLLMQNISFLQSGYWQLRFKENRTTCWRIESYRYH